MAFGQQRGTQLNLAQIYTALKTRFGETSESYDDYKGSFAFPFFLHLQKSGRSYPYLLRIRDHKGSLEFDFRRVIDPNDKHYDRDVYHEPLAEEFSREEINAFVIYFFGFLEGYFSVIGTERTEFFFRTIEARWAVYGCKDGQFFEEAYDSEEAYRAAIEGIETLRVHWHSKQTHLLHRRPAIEQNVGTCLLHVAHTQRVKMG